MTLFDAVMRADTIFDQAQALFNHGRLQEASRLFQETHALRPRPRSHFGIALASAALGRRQDALSSYRTAIELDFKFWQARVNLGVLLRESRELAQAMQQHLLAYALAPDDGSTFYNLAETHFAAGNRHAARALIEQCCARNPGFVLAQRSA